MMRMLMREILPGRRTIRSRFLRRFFVVLRRFFLFVVTRQQILFVWEFIMGMEV